MKNQFNKLALAVMLAHAVAASAEPVSGMILDRNGVVMAQTEAIDEIVFDRSHSNAKQNAAKLTAAMARIAVGLPQDWFSSKLLSGSGNEAVIRIELSDDARRTLVKVIADMPGINLRKNTKREYLVAAAVDQALERSFNDQLGGEAPKNLHTSIDGKLQLAAERAFGGRPGTLAALDPNTGDVLALVSIPASGSGRPGEASSIKVKNLAIAGTYNPGSTIKPFLALAALELGMRTAEDEITDKGFYPYGNHRYLDGHKSGHGRVNLHRSIVQSCDTYYYGLADDMGIDAMHRFLGQFGFGSKPGVAPEEESAGLLPSPEWKEERFKQQWFNGDTVATGIGQGYFLASPIQMARAVTMLANGGTLYRPRLVKSIADTATGESSSTLPKVDGKVALDAKHLATIRNAMVAATKQGAASRSFADAGYLVAGKTGSMFSFATNKDGSVKTLKDHSLFIGYAPANKPAIVLAVIVENGGLGYQSAAPIARAVLDNFLGGKEIRKTVPELPEQKNARASD